MLLILGVNPLRGCKSEYGVLKIKDEDLCPDEMCRRRRGRIRRIEERVFFMIIIRQRMAMVEPYILYIRLSVAYYCLRNHIKNLL